MDLFLQVHYHYHKFLSALAKENWSSGYGGLAECAFPFSTAVVFRLLHYIIVGKMPQRPLPHVQIEQADIKKLVI